MSNLTKYLKPEEIAALKEKGPEFIEKFEKQQSNQLYKDANFLYNRTQLKQMEKAAEKYPNPLNPDDWTSEELIDHAFQELVDQSHYLTTLNYKIDQYEKTIESLKGDVEYWRNKALKKEGE